MARRWTASPYCDEFWKTSNSHPSLRSPRKGFRSPCTTALIEASPPRADVICTLDRELIAEILDAPVSNTARINLGHPLCTYDTSPQQV